MYYTFLRVASSDRPLRSLWQPHNLTMHTMYFNVTLVKIYMYDLLWNKISINQSILEQVHQWMEDQRPGRYLTFGGRYLTFGGKNQNSAALRFCIWPFYTFLCDISTIQWKLLDEFAKVWKKHQKRQVFPSLWPWPWPGDLETYARIFMYPRSIYPASFVKFG